jgi:integrase/recombinase XerC
MIQRNELKEKAPDEKALFLSSWNRRMSVRNMEVLVKKYCARAGINKKMSPHKLRATFATMLYNLTGDVYLVADILGHQDVATTKEHYADMSGKRKEESRNIVQF